MHFCCAFKAPNLTAGGRLWVKLLGSQRVIRACQVKYLSRFVDLTWVVYTPLGQEFVLYIQAQAHARRVVDTLLRRSIVQIKITHEARTVAEPSMNLYHIYNDT
jgi:hypothetical protein